MRAAIQNELAEVCVAEAMHAGVFTVPLDAPLREVAATMAVRRVHCVVACDSEAEPQELWGVVSDLDLVGAASAGELDIRTAGATAVTPLVTIGPGEPLDRAAQLMTENAVAHLVVVDPLTARPLGVLSTLDIAGAVAEIDR
jgi:CBS domain-containing protein